MNELERWEKELECQRDELIQLLAPWCPVKPRKRKALIADRRSDIATVKRYIEELKREQTPHFSGGSNPIDFPKAS